MAKSILSSDMIKSYQDELAKAYNSNLAVKQEYIQDSHVQGGGYYKNVRYNPNKDEGNKKVRGMHDHVADNFETFSIKDPDKNFKYKSKREQKLFGEIMSRLTPAQVESCRGTGICASNPGALEWLHDINFNIHKGDMGTLAMEHPYIRKLRDSVSDDLDYTASMRKPASMKKIFGDWYNPNSGEKESSGSHDMLNKVLDKIQQDNPEEHKNVEEYKSLIDSYRQNATQEVTRNICSPRFLNINTKLVVAYRLAEKISKHFKPTKDFISNLDTSKSPSGMVISTLKLVPPKEKSIYGGNESAFESKDKHGEKAKDKDREIKCKIVPLSLDNQKAIQAHVEKYWSGNKKPIIQRVFKISGLSSETSYKESKGDKKSAVLFYPTNDVDLTTILGQQGGFTEPVHLNKLPSTTANNLVLCEVVQGSLTKGDGYNYVANNPKTVIPRYIINMG